MSKSRINKILVISLSNIGDAILTTVVLEALKYRFPSSNLSVLTSSRARQVFIHDSSLNEVITYDKFITLKEKVKLCRSLRKKRYNLIIDLRNSLFPLFISSIFKVSFALNFSPYRKLYNFPYDSKKLRGDSRAFLKKNMHITHKHLRKIKKFTTQLVSLDKLKALNKSHAYLTRFRDFSPKIYYNSQDIEYIENILDDLELQGEKFAVVAPGAKSDTKRWKMEGFVEVAKKLYRNFGIKVILVGESKDKILTDKISNLTGVGIYDFAGRTTIPQLTYLLTKAKILITNDSAILHVASCVGVSTISIFGPTDPNKYGPLSMDSKVIIKKELKCAPCEKAKCRYRQRFCLELITPEQVLKNIEDILKNPLHIKPSYDFKKILVVRTDRIGDVLLSTPAIELLRRKFPASFIAMMVRPYVKDVLKNNPWIDKIITYDKYRKDKNPLATLKFAYELRKQKFDLSIILHPTNRAHIISFLAGIPVRVGYNRKFSFLLTHRIKHIKQLGTKHEVEYNIEFLTCIGIKGSFKRLKIFTNKKDEELAAKLFKEEGVMPEDILIAIHPGASCPSKRWPPEFFGELANILISKFGAKIVLISGREDNDIIAKVKQFIKYPIIDLTARLSLSELACILKVSKLLISNDAGPVHIACGVNTPVIDIFGRKQPGLSPRRWGPTGERDIVLHKDVGCKICLAHNCKLNFACLRAITVEDALEAVRKTGILNYQETSTLSLG